MLLVAVGEGSGRVPLSTSLSPPVGAVLWSEKAYLGAIAMHASISRSGFLSGAVGNGETSLLSSAVTGVDWTITI
jgi:hypothetical protein